MDEATKELLKSGLLGAIIIILLGGLIATAKYIVYLHKTHMQQVIEIAKESNEAIRNNSNVVTKLTTLFETTRERKQ